MSDLNLPLALGEDEQLNRQVIVNDARKREMLRKSLDIWRIYNDLDEPFGFKWDGFPITLQPHEKKDVEYYIAVHFFKKISQYIMGKEFIEEGMLVKNQIEKDSGKRFREKEEENRQVWDYVTPINDQTRQSQLFPRFVLGMVKEYGKDILPEQVRERQTTMDFRPIEDQIFDMHRKKGLLGPLEDAPVTPTQPIPSVKKKMEENIL